MRQDLLNRIVVAAQLAPHELQQFTNTPLTPDEVRSLSEGTVGSIGRTVFGMNPLWLSIHQVIYDVKLDYWITTQALHSLAHTDQTQANSPKHN